MNIKGPNYIIWSKFETIYASIVNFVSDVEITIHVEIEFDNFIKLFEDYFTSKKSSGFKRFDKLQDKVLVI